MRLLISSMIVLSFAQSAIGQPPRPPGRGPGGDRPAPTAEDFLARLMTFDKNQDGRLAREEVTDSRLHPLLTRADVNQDGAASTEELKAIHARESAALASGRGFGPPGGGPMGPGGMPRPGEVLPPRLQGDLKLTERQREELATLQKDVDARLEKILTPEQWSQLSQMRERGPGGLGRSGGRGEGTRPMQGGGGDRPGRRPPSE